MDIFKILRTSAKEFLSFKGYKANFAPVLCGILALPLSLASFALYIFLFLMGIFLKLASFVRDFLYKFIVDCSEVSSVKHGSQIVIYIVGYPLIFFLTIPIAILSCAFEVLFFFFECLLFCASLGGINFQPNALDYKEKSDFYLKRSTYTIPKIVMLIVSCVLLTTVFIVTFIWLGSFGFNGGTISYTVSFEDFITKYKLIFIFFGLYNLGFIPWSIITGFKKIPFDNAQSQN